MDTYTIYSIQGQGKKPRPRHRRLKDELAETRALYEAECEARRKAEEMLGNSEGKYHSLGHSCPSRAVRIDIVPGLAVMADAGLTRILIENLLRNSWKFTSKKNEAFIEFGVIDSGEPQTFFVRDNGAGFDSRGAANLFRPFVRLHSDEEFKGTGIGLATVKRIVDKHGGDVWAKGEVDKGATIYFRLS